MKKRPPADYIRNPGRKPTWTKDQMEEAIDRYFQVGNFNRVAEECGVPVSTLFYKVKIDSRYGKKTRKDVSKEEGKREEAEPKPDSPEEVSVDWKQVFEETGMAALIGTAVGAGFKGGSYALERFFGPEGKKKLLYGNEKEQMEAASRFCLSFVYTLRALTGLTDPFGEGVKPYHITVALAYVLDLDIPNKQ